MAATVAEPEIGPTPARSRGLMIRIAGVLFSPRAVYAEVAAQPRSAGVLVLVTLIAAGGTFALLSTAVGKEAWIDAAVLQQESVGRTLTDGQYARLEAIARYAAPLFAGVQAVALPVLCTLIAGLAFAVFNAALGGSASFSQVFAIVAHSGVVIALSQLFNLPLAYTRQTMTGAANLAVFAPVLDESSFAARFLGAIDLFLIWWTVSLAIGLGVLYRRRTAPIAATLIAIYVAIGVVIAAVKTALSGA
jgi:Yip1-like protein